MWHEARRQERKIRGMLVDYRRRAERRRDFYERIKADPTQFLQIHGRQCKIHLDPAIAAAADSPAAMMPWQNQADNLIDRFDVRAHLDHILPVKKEEEEELTLEERHLNYERYRIIAQNSFLALSEEKFLKQLHLEEQFGYTDSKSKKEKEKSGGVAIGFNYEDGTGTSSQSQPQQYDQGDQESEHSDSDLDVDLAINVSKMDSLEAHEMNRHGRNYGMSSNDFYSFLINDLEEAESYKMAKEEEHEKALYSGRKSRRERRAHREKRLANRVISPPSYAARTSPTYADLRKSKSASKSPSPDNAGKITYITSFGDEEDVPSTSKPTYADKVKMGLSSKKKESSSERTVQMCKSKLSDYNLGSKRKRSSSTDLRTRSKTVRSRSRDRYIRKPRSESKSPKRSYRSRKSSSRSSTSSSSSSSLPSLSSSSSGSHSESKSRSSSTKSTTAIRTVTNIELKSSPKFESVAKVLPRYYGRKRSDQSSSGLSDDNEMEINDQDNLDNLVGTTTTGYGNSGTAIKKIPQVNFTIQDRLKRKRQALLNKQFKADKIAEQIKTEREKQEQQTREDELREMAIKLRRRQREKRHAYDSHSSNTSDSETNNSNKEKSRSRSKSGSSSEKDTRKIEVEEEEEDKRSSYYTRRSPALRSEEKKIVSKDIKEKDSFEKEKDGRERKRESDRNRKNERDRRDERERERDKRYGDKRDSREYRDEYSERWHDRHRRGTREDRERERKSYRRGDDRKVGEEGKQKVHKSLVDY